MFPVERCVLPNSTSREQESQFPLGWIGIQEEEQLGGGLRRPREEEHLPRKEETQLRCPVNQSELWAFHYKERMV